MLASLVLAASSLCHRLLMVACTHLVYVNIARTFLVLPSMSVPKHLQDRIRESTSDHIMSHHVIPLC
jgi:hypothetical protein